MMQKMKMENLRHPEGCLKYLGVKVGFPKKIVAAVAERFIETTAVATQLDIFMQLYEMLDEYLADSDLTTERLLYFKENIARCCFINMAAYDFAWDFK